MTLRDRSSPVSGSIALPASPADLVAPLSPLMLTSCPARSLLWEQWYERASPAQREQVLAQASTGMVLAHQLPTPVEERPTVPTVSLAGLQTHPLEALERLAPDTVDPQDAALDATQRRAVATALATPDIALILGYPGSGKSRILRELLCQAVQRGLRVLFLASSDAALDGVLEPLAAEPGLGIVRCLPGGESANALPACVARLCLPQRVRLFHEQTLPAARQAYQTAQEARQAHEQDGVLWERLVELVAQFETLSEQRARLVEQVNGLSAAVEKQMQATGSEGADRTAWHEAHQRYHDICRQIDSQLAALQAEADQLTASLRQHEADRRQLAPLVEAKQAQRWWTGAWWKATVQGDPRPRLLSLEDSCRQVTDKLDALQQEMACLASRRDQASARLHDDCQQVIAGAVARQRAHLDQEVARIERQETDLLTAWQGLVDTFRQSRPSLATPNRTALVEARTAWEQERPRLEQEVVASRTWLEAVEQAAPGLAAQLVHQARIVAALPTCIPGPGEMDVPDFDLLIVEEAERLGEAELVQASRRARRWILVGEAPAQLPIATPPRRPGAGRSRPALPTPLFHRLWNRFHTDPRQLAVRWRHTGDRLIACLRSANEQHPPQLEPVFDRPEIELAIVAPPGQEPRIVEVHFPAAISPADAREYIFRELQELAIQADGPALRWTCTDEVIRVELSAPGEESVRIPLDSGVHEILTSRTPTVGSEGDLPWRTQAVEFALTEGWDRAAAERWLFERLGLRDLGRTVVLEHSYRAGAELGRFLSGLLFAGSCTAGNRTEGIGLAGRSAVELIPVPASGRAEGRRGSDADLRRSSGLDRPGRARPVRANGAGLEIDLADAVRPDVMPLELRTHLPPRGIVNFLEARTLVGELENLVSAADFQSACAEWQAARLRCPSPFACPPHKMHPGPAVAIMSLFPAQVELLRVLIERSAILSATPITIEIGLPTAFQQRECLVALISLTRSHTHLAVPFSDHPQSLILALTRPVARLMLFADPGTLARRSQWFGVLEHLDETAGPVEQALVGQLLEHLAGPEPAPRFGRALESSRV